MVQLVFTNRIKNSSLRFDSDEFENMDALVAKLTHDFNIVNYSDFKIFAFGKDMKPIYLESLDQMVQLVADLKCMFNVYYKIVEHGKQEVDMEAHGSEKVVSGFKRFVNRNGGDITIGNPNGAHVFIPAGALADSATVSIQEVLTDEILPGNVTRHVPCNPDEVNRKMNGK
jgi:hypothetical protein